MIYNSYKRLKKLFHFEYETNFCMSHRLSNIHLLSVDLTPYTTPRKLYNKEVEIYKYIENKENPKLSDNKLIFSTKSFEVLKDWLKYNGYL